MRLLILGCHGHDDGIVQMCSGTSSVLLDLDAVHPNDIKTNNFLFRLNKLDRVPATDHNKVVSIIRAIVESGYIDQQTYKVYEKYIQMHKACGMYIYMRKE